MTPSDNIEQGQSGGGRMRWLDKALCAGVLLTATTGCGTGAYEALISQRIERLQREAPYTALNAPAVIVGTGVKLAVPKALTREINLETPDPQGLKGKISAERVKFAPIPLPGTYVAFDGETAIDNEMKAPMALQVAIFSKADPAVAPLPQLIGESVKKLSGADVVWEEVTADSLDGAKVPWKVMRYEGELLFDLIPNDPNAALLFRKLPAKAQLWWHESEPYHTFLLWRIPTAAEDREKLLDLAPLTAGLITVDAPAPAEAPPAGG